MTHQRYRVLGHLRTGGGFYVTRHTRTAANNGRTISKAHAWTMTHAEAEDMVERFHRVQTLGHHHQDVAHYAVVRMA